MPPPNVTNAGPRAPSSLKMRDLDAEPLPKAIGTVPLTVPAPKEADAFDETSKATTFSQSGGVQHVDGRLSGKTEYANLPSDLKSKLSDKVWYALPEGQRGTLVASYQQFKRAGVWDEITKVTGEKEKREAPVRLPGGYQTNVAGNSGAIQYEVKDAKRFTAKMLELNPNFGVDGGIMGALHAGQTSMREHADQRSLHISVGPGNKMDAHIDQEMPVDMPKNGQTQMNVWKGIQHWSHEVLPEMIRKHTGIPGVIVQPSVTPGSRDQQAEGKLMVNLEFHGISKTKPRVAKEPMEGSSNVPAQVVKNLAEKLEGVSFPRPKGVDAGSAPDPKELASAIAAKVQEAVENGSNRITIDIPAYAGQKGYQSAATGDTARIAKLVMAEMKAAGVDVSGITGITVTYGKRNAHDRFATEGETVALP